MLIEAKKSKISKRNDYCDPPEEDGGAGVLLGVHGPAETEVLGDGLGQHAAEDHLGPALLLLQVVRATREDEHHVADALHRDEGVVDEEGDDGQLGDDDEGVQDDGEGGRGDVSVPTARRQHVADGVGQLVQNGREVVALPVPRHDGRHAGGRRGVLADDVIGQERERVVGPKPP